MTDFNFIHKDLPESDMELVPKAFVFKYELMSLPEYMIENIKNDVYSQNELIGLSKIYLVLEHIENKDYRTLIKLLAGI